MKRILPISVVVMFVVACGTGYFVYGAYKDYRGESTTSSVSDDAVLMSDEEFLASMRKSYFNEVEYTVSQWSDFASISYREVQKGLVDDSNREKIITQANELLFEIQSFNAEPVTDEDYIFYEHAEDFFYDAEKYIEYTLQYIQKEESVYRTFQKDSYDNIMIHLDTLIRLEEKYYK